jgi:hypothetical protein
MKLGPAAQAGVDPLVQDLLRIPPDTAGTEGLGMRVYKGPSCVSGLTLKHIPGDREIDQR